MRVTITYDIESVSIAQDSHTSTQELTMSSPGQPHQTTKIPARHCVLDSPNDPRIIRICCHSNNLLMISMIHPAALRYPTLGYKASVTYGLGSLKLNAFWKRSSPVPFPDLGRTQITLSDELSVGLTSDTARCQVRWGRLPRSNTTS